jgi:hypothetical protein
MSARPIDEWVVKLFFQALAPAQLEIALEAVDQLQQQRRALRAQWDSQLEQARYEAHLAQRQYDAADPDYRLVTSELERRWNDKLEAVQRLERAYAEAEQHAHFSINAEEQAIIQRLAQDLPKVWNAPTTTDQERKQLLRYVIAQVQLDGVSTEGKIAIEVTWHSGAITRYQIDRLKRGAWAPRTDDQVIQRIRDLAERMTVAQMGATRLALPP